MLSDIEIITGCKKGHQMEQRLLYLRYAPVLKGVCLRYIKDRDKAADVLQDTFIKIFKNIHQFLNENSLEGWMRRIAVNTCLDHLRKEKSNPIDISKDGAWNDYAESDSDNAYSNEIMEQVLNAGLTPTLLLEVLTNIPENYSKVFNMVYIDGMSHREIAEIMQINEAASRKWAFRAKDLVKKQLVDYVKTNLKNQ